VDHLRQIVQVLVSLMVNAGQATAPAGLVRITTRLEGEQVLVTVRDTWLGMSEATKRRLFEPFFTTKTPGVGMGLGLSVAHGIVRAQDSHIDVGSELGMGTVFTLPPTWWRLREARDKASASQHHTLFDEARLIVLLCLLRDPNKKSNRSRGTVHRTTASCARRAGKRDRQDKV
jgi:hypothetical protein